MGRNKRRTLAFLNSIGATAPPSLLPTPRPPVAQSWQPSAEMERFLQRLGATPNRWHLDQGGKIRGNTPEDPYQDCPLTAVARQAGWAISIDAWKRATSVVGLPLREAENVVATADNRDGDRYTFRRIPELRALLLAATVNRPIAPEAPAPATPDPMDRVLAELIAEGVPAEPAGEELAIV